MNLSKRITLFSMIAFVFACGGERTERPIADYSYDHNNRRIHQSVTGVGERTFIYDLDDRLIAEMDKDGNTLVEYIYLNGRQIAMANNTGTPEEKLYHTFTDHLGTPEVMTDTEGKEVWRREQLPFGETVKIEGEITQNMRFPGQRYHSETGLHYNLNRDYDPETGRYIQSDPIGISGGINTFLYANNNPIMNTDPTGLVVEPDPVYPSDVIGIPVFGTWVHSLFGREMTSRNPGFLFNVSYGPGFFGRGPNKGSMRADLIDPVTRRLWELKPLSSVSSGYDDAKGQLNGYCSMATENDGSLWLPGNSYSLLGNQDRMEFRDRQFYDGSRWNITVYADTNVTSGLLFYTATQSQSFSENAQNLIEANMDLLKSTSSSMIGILPGPRLPIPR